MMKSGNSRDTHRRNARALIAVAEGIALILTALMVGCAPIPLLTEVQHNVETVKNMQAVEVPTFIPAGSGGTYTSSIDMTGANAISIADATPGAVVHYTTDGSTPTVSTTAYTGPISLTGNGTNVTIKAVGTKSGMTDSALAQQTFIINYNTVSTPQFNPVAGTYPASQTIQLTTTTTGATIYYTTDGSDPTTSGTRSTYGAPVPIAGHGASVTIKAYAVKGQMADSSVATAVYNLPTYSVTYDGNGNTTGTAPVDSTSYLEGTQVTVLGSGTLVKAGYAFTGWKDGGGTLHSVNSTFFINSNMTLHAQWQFNEFAAADGALNDCYGNSVAISGDGNTLVIGAPMDMLVKAGAVYVYTKSGSTFSLAQTLVAPDGAVGDEFGFSVAASNDGSILLVGADRKKAGTFALQGAAYVFIKSGSNWTQKQELTASDGQANDQFGYSVAVSGTGGTLVVGAVYNPFLGGAFDMQGAAYAFTGNSTSGWTQQAKLVATDPAAYDYFGSSVAVSNDASTVVAGARNKNSQEGAAYVFKYTTSWDAGTKLSYSGGVNTNFGSSVSASIDGKIVLVGAKGALGIKGAAYVYTYTTGWSGPQGVTVPSDVGNNDRFGSSISLSSNGSVAVVGAFGNSTNPGSNSYQGAAYAYSTSDLTSPKKLLSSDGQLQDFFGQSVAASSDGSALLIGAYMKTFDSNIGKQGAAYLFTGNATTGWNQWTQ